jgi:hypothetical protein
MHSRPNAHEIGEVMLRLPQSEQRNTDTMVSMADVSQKIQVLYVDQAETFGGSLVVAGMLVDWLDKQHFSASSGHCFPR